MSFNKFQSETSHLAQLNKSILRQEKKTLKLFNHKPNTNVLYWPQTQLHKFVIQLTSFDQ